MILLYILIIISLFLVVLLFTVASKIIVHFNSAASDLNVTVLWLDPVLKFVVSSENNSFILSVYLFKKIFFKKQLTNSRINIQNRNFISKITPADIHINAQYGFRDPYFTGLAFCAINMISKFFTLESLYQKPDFLADDDFLNIEATARLNLGRSLLKLV